MLVLIIGPGGVGKDTIVNEMVKKYGYNKSISYTTRKPRPNEKDGVDYHFVNRDEFMYMVEQNMFLEYAEFNGNYYGTPSNYDDNKINLLIVDVQGGLSLRQKHACVSIFIKPPNMKELRNRLVKRGTDSEKEIDRRMKLAFDEILNMDKFDFIVENDDLNKAIDDVNEIINHQKQFDL